MTDRRKRLVPVLVLLVVLLIFAGVLGGVGTVELGIWGLLVLTWIVAFVVWGGRTHARESQ